MIDVPEMVMIGGNSRNTGKTTLACNIISKLSETHEVVGLKVTSIRPGEEDLHGTHCEEVASSYTILEELNSESPKDTSKMLRAGATHVYYIRVTEVFMEKAILHFLSCYINNQLIVCESRSLREILKPGLFVMMMRSPVVGTAKDVSTYLSMADKVYCFEGNQTEIGQFAESLCYDNGKYC
jgi:hypothetical protein